jgi:hypothetical protein
MEMTSAQTSRFRRLAPRYFFSGSGLALLTFVCFRLELGLAATGFVYLVLITLLSPTASFIESALTWATYTNLATLLREHSNTWIRRDMANIFPWSVISQASTKSSTR